MTMIDKNENRITGPGYYPKRPTSWQCLTPDKDLPGYGWYGWYVDTRRPDLHAHGVADYVFVLAKPFEASSAFAARLRATGKVPGSRLSGEGSFCGGTYKELLSCTEGRTSVLHWPDGSFRLYSGRTPQELRGRRVP